MKTVYFIIADAIKGNPNWDTFSGAYENRAEAIAAAEREWRYLTAREKKNRRITVNHASVPARLPLKEAFDYICESGDGWFEDWSSDELGAITLRNKSKRTITVYELPDGFSVEVHTSGDQSDFWLAHESYGVKMLMFGICKCNEETEERSIIANAQEYIDIYRDEYLD